MSAMYFMGMYNGVSKKTNEQYWSISILWYNAFGSYEIVTLYCTPELWKEVSAMGLARGTAVEICAIGKSITALSISKRFKPLNLGEAAK